MGEVQRRYVGGVVEHSTQLRGEELDFVVAQLKASQVRHVDHVFSTESHVAPRRVCGVTHGRGDDRTLVTNSTVRDSISSLS
jgi:hypothetical protein